MKDIKKLILTLALLITAVTGAWADQLASSYSSNATLNAVTVSASMEVTIATGVTVTINNGLNITSGTLTVKGPGTLVVNGKAGSNGYNSEEDDAGAGGTGGVAISGNIIVQGGATVKATGGNGGNGGKSEMETGGNGAQGGAAITGEVTIQDASTLEATGGNGGNGGWGGYAGGNGGNGANAIGGTLNYKGGTVTANGGNGGSGGWNDSVKRYESSGSAGKAFTTSVNFVSSDYILTDGSNAITATQVTSKKKVVISPKVAVNSVTLSQTAASMTLGETEMVTLTATVDPNDATDPTVKWNVTAGADKVKLYKDENCSTEVGTAATDVLTVYAKCLAVGEATVTVTSNDDATKTAACTVTVIPSGPEVSGPTIVDGKPQWTFSMPGGNVTLVPEYYPQAALAAAPTAINNVPATTDGAIVNAGTVKNIGETTNAQGTVMYYVSQTALDDAALQALAADQWTADVPTAADLAQGQAHVYYYVRGNDSDNDAENFSDGDILATNALTVTIAAEPTYALTMKEGTQDADKWTVKAGTDGSFQSLPLEGVKAGTKVKLKYDGDRSMLKGVKAVKKGGAVDNAYLKWDGTQKKLVSTEMPESFTTVTSENTEWSAGTYVVEGQVSITGTITLKGNVDLIIKDGAKLTAKHINGFNGNSSSYNLSIYGQANQTGELVINRTDGNAIMDINTLEVHSAKVTATSSADLRGGFSYISTFNVYGGLVDAKNTGSKGFGIYLKEIGYMNIWGGEVKAEGKGSSYGITSSASISMDAAYVRVYGGKLWAGNANNRALNDDGIYLTKGTGFTGKIEYSSDNSNWSETFASEYVRVGY